MVPALTGAAGRKEEEEEAESSPGRDRPWLRTAHSPSCGCDRVPHPQPHLLPLFPPPRKMRPSILAEHQRANFPKHQAPLSLCLMLIVTSSPLPLHLSRPPQSLPHSEKNGGKSLLAAGAHTVTGTELGWSPNPPPYTGSAAATCAPDAPSGQDATSCHGTLWIWSTSPRSLNRTWILNSMSGQHLSRSHLPDLGPSSTSDP